MMKPSKPAVLLSSFGRELLNSISQDIDGMISDQHARDDMREDIWKTIRSIQTKSHQIHFAFRIGDFDRTMNMLAEGDKCLAEILDKLGENHSLREGNVSQCVEKMTGARLLYKFFESGKLAGMDEVQPCRDEEYIGAVLSFAMDISKYCVGRAIAEDEGSIELVKKMITQLNGKMLEFNFRNGPLRRKFDVLKYSLKNVENICYEYSLSKPFDAAAPAKKKMKADDGAAMEVTETENASANTAESAKSGCEDVVVDDKETLIDAASLDAIRIRMDTYDALRVGT
jgi:predicted translin family RNA/ssDNA-binding protein